MRSWISAAVVGVVLALLPFAVGSYILGLLVFGFYYAVFAMSWDLLFGFAGEVNFGPSFLIGVGAYAAALLNHYFNTPIPLCLVAAAVAAVVAGLILAVPALRLTGPYFGLITLVAVLLLQTFIVLYSGITGGEIGLDLPDVFANGEVRANYWIALAFMSISGAILFGLSRSAVGLILQASGQDRIEAAALGYNVTKHKLAAFCISALFSGLAGAMQIFSQGTASVGLVVDIAVGVQAIIGAVLGGRRTIFGAAIGAIFLVAAQELLRPLGQLSIFVVSAFALLVILFFPGGFLGAVGALGGVLGRSAR